MRVEMRGVLLQSIIGDFLLLCQEETNISYAFKPINVIYTNLQTYLYMNKLN